MAEECLLHAMDLSGLLLLYSSLGDAEGLTKLTSMAKEQCCFPLFLHARKT
jgi:coatomer subunit beta'